MRCINLETHIIHLESDGKQDGMQSKWLVMIKVSESCTPSFIFTSTFWQNDMLDLVVHQGTAACSRRSSSDNRVMLHT